MGQINKKSKNGKYLRKEVSMAALIISGFGLVFFVSYFLPLNGTRFGNLRDNVASIVGVSASVPTNQYNTLAQQLKEQQQGLDTREQRIVEQEASLGKKSGRDFVQNRIVIFGIAISSFLFALVSVNFYLDWKRKFSQ